MSFKLSLTDYEFFFAGFSLKQISGDNIIGFSVKLNSSWVFGVRRYPKLFSKMYPALKE